MNVGRSLRDVGLVAGFEVLRALRTWRAQALVLVYVVANLGGAYLFVEILGEIERNLATQMGVATTRWPGVLSEELRSSEELSEMVGFLVGDPETAAAVLSYPLLAIWQLWVGLLLVPFLSSTAASEALCLDVGNRAIRYEALRTGRIELVAGRFLGQLALSLLATAISLALVWCLGMALVHQQDPVELAIGLAWLGLRAVAFAFPFAGLGLAVSQITTSAGWARVLAIAGTAASWVLYGVTNWVQDDPWVYATDALAPLLPQSWLDALWIPGPAWLGSAGVCFALGVAAVGAGFLVFDRRDL